MRYRKGESGNPGGRPRGIIDKRAPWRKLLEQNAPELIQAIVKNALGGNVIAQQLCLERLVAKARDNPQPFDVDTTDLVTAIDETLEAAKRGEMTLADAKDIAAIVDVRIRAGTESYVNEKITEFKEFKDAILSHGVNAVQEQQAQQAQPASQGGGDDKK